MKIFIALALSIFLTQLVACGGDSGSSSPNNIVPESDLVSETYDDLLVCSGLCEGGEWNVDAEKDAESADASAEVSGSFGGPAPIESSSSNEKTQSSESKDWSSGGDALSSVEESRSSSSVTPKSSSSDTRVSSSSFSAKSSSSNEPESAEASSSSVKIEMYSSSEKFVDSSGSEKVEESSSSLQNTSPDSSYFNAEKNTLTDFRNGQIYKTATIGNQIWMAENLNYEVDGQSYCYNNSADSCAKYGRLYTWAAAVGKSEEECGNGKTCGLSGKVRGVCPEGWYLPSDSEWSSLYSAMGRSPYAMQAKGFANWPDATDAYGFSALPTGHYIDGKYDRGFFGVGYYAYFWGSTEGDSSSAYRWNIRANGTTFYEYHYDVKYAGFSVRCLKDEETP
ncbi:fibrobacter succinogenes major paralogous domain-containing protein [Fibrobacter succinogenes]|uniref:fibrobacter succinogenes major paralogous domain-containing protein n=1 Tax=Fibrobacter succinogenes TaxID=833 RepID=UPI0013D70F20|nr:fibrobacter succinogenes major paralogous domain-containing protein [Fibrobacter succinogenes]